MSQIVFITPRIAVSGALEAGDMTRLAAAGFRAIVSNRTDGEDPGQLDARTEAVLAWRAGLQFRHVPAAKHEIFEAGVVEALADALAILDGPVLLHCKSGLRSALMWAAASARNAPIDCVMAALSKAGFDAEDLREEIAAHSGVKRRLGSPAALDCETAVAA